MRRLLNLMKVEVESSFHFFKQLSQDSWVCIGCTFLVFMIVEPLPDIDKLSNSNHYRYNYNMTFLSNTSCVSFRNVLIICEYSLKANQKINGLKLIGKIGELTSDWNVINKNIFELVTLIPGNQALCQNCRSVIKDEFKSFQQLLISLKNIQHIQMAGIYVMAGFNKQLKETLVQFYVKISQNCNDWKFNKEDYQRIFGRKAQKQIQYVEKNNQELHKNQRETKIEVLKAQQEQMIKREVKRQPEQEHLGQVKQEAQQQDPPSSQSQQQPTRGAPTHSNQERVQRPEKKNTEKKHKQ